MQWGVMAGLARAADASEVWDSIWVYDQFHTVPENTDEATHEAWTLMAAFAAVTGRVRLGQMSTSMGYRNPVLLAKMAATVDVIAEGRLDVGIGAGWHEQEWLAYGYGFPAAGERLGMLEEGADILRQAWMQGTVSADGDYYLAERAAVQPRPLQGTSLPGAPRTGIPLWVDGGGERRTLRVAAEYAAVAHLDPDPEAFARRRDALMEHCREVGRDETEIQLAASYDVVIGRDDKEVRTKLELYRQRLIDAGVGHAQAEAQVEQMRSGPTVGTPDRVCDGIEHMRALGLDRALAYFPEAAFDMSGIELFESYVIPEFSGRGRHRR